MSLEGYVAGSLLLEGLKRVGPQLGTEKLVEALETVRDFDMGLGAPISFGPTEHQGSHKVWGRKSSPEKSGKEAAPAIGQGSSLQHKLETRRRSAVGSS